MMTVGQLAPGSFDPTAYLTHFDTGKVSRLPSGQVLREYELVAEDREIEVAPGVFYPAWTYNGQVPGPTIRCTEGDRIRIRFTNRGVHAHSVHFHGIHPSNMDGAFEPVHPGHCVRLRIRRRAVRPASLSLPHGADQAAPAQGTLRRLHHRPQAGPSPRARDGDDDERLRHQLRQRERGLRRQHRRVPLPETPDRAPAQRAEPDLSGQHHGVRSLELVAPAREPLPALPHRHRSRPLRVDRHRDAGAGRARGAGVQLQASPARSCSMPTRASSPSSAGRASSTSRLPMSDASIGAAKGETLAAAALECPALAQRLSAARACSQRSSRCSCVSGPSACSARRSRRSKS